MNKFNLSLVLLLLVVIVAVVHRASSSTTVCDCEPKSGGCEKNEWQEGSCKIGKKTYPRCCKKTGSKDHCECREKCKPHEYQREECGDSGYVCCERGFDPY